MDWVRIHPMIQNWPGGGPPPVFDVSADENGSAVVELAWDPQALASPSAGYAPLRYYSSGSAASVNYTDDRGASQSLNLPAQAITLSGNRATWAVPQALWDAYVQESLKSLRAPPTTTFANNLYYRVRVTPAGAAPARVWPADPVLTGTNASAAPHIGLLPISASPSSQVVPDQQAVAAMGGIPLILPNAWGDLLTALWKNLPETDPSRQVLAKVFAHQAFQSADLPTRAALLKLWLFAGTSARPQLPQLLDRNAVVGTNVVIPIVSKNDLRGSKTLAQNLLALLDVTPHPDLVSASPPVTSKEQLLDHVITEILDPNGQVNQGAAGTCSPTSLQTLLLTINPSEYARLQCGWLSSAGQATLANGSVADLPAGVLQVANYATLPAAPFLARTFSELAFQGAVLKYAQGAAFPAFTGTPANLNQIFQATIKAGLSADQSKKALEGIFNTPFTVHYIAFPIDQTSATWLAAQQAIRDGFLGDLPARQQQMLLAVFWAQPYQFGHMVMAIRRDGGRVFYKNPQYAGSLPAPGVAAGGNAANPPRRFEDPTGSLESIAEADLASWIKGYFVPNTAII